MKKAKYTAMGLSIFALITIYESLRLGIWERGFPTSGTFPFLLGLLLFFLSAMYFWQFVLKKTEKRGEETLKTMWAEGPGRVLEASNVDWKKVLLSMGAIAVYPFLFIKGGYIIGTAIFLLFMCKFVERLNVMTTLAVTLGTIIVSYTVFVILLKVPLH